MVAWEWVRATGLILAFTGTANLLVYPLTRVKPNSWGFKVSPQFMISSPPWLTVPVAVAGTLLVLASFIF